MSMKKVKKFANIIENQCVGCGSCIHVCPRAAITVPKGIYAVVDKELCVGCGLCQKICPASVIEMLTQESKKEDK